MISIKIICAKAVLMLSAICTASWVHADEGWHSEVEEIAQTYSELFRIGKGIEYTLAHMHPHGLSDLAREFGLSEADAIQQIKNGYAMSAEVLEIVSHNVHLTNGQFGQAAEHKWGAIPFSSQTKLRNSGDLLGRHCSWLIVFEEADRWYFEPAYHFMDENDVNSRFPKAMQSVVKGLGQPNCNAQISMTQAAPVISTV